MIALREDDLTGAATRALLALHLAGMRASSPPCQVFALELSGLQAADVTAWTNEAPKIYYFDLEDLAEPHNLNTLRAVFHDPESLRSKQSRASAGWPRR